MTLEARNTLAEIAQDATPEELRLCSIFMHGIHAAAQGNTDAAQIIANIDGTIRNKGSRQEVITLTEQLAELLNERNV